MSAPSTELNTIELEAEQMEMGGAAVCRSMRWSQSTSSQTWAPDSGNLESPGNRDRESTALWVTWM